VTCSSSDCWCANRCTDMRLQWPLSLAAKTSSDVPTAAEFANAREAFTSATVISSTGERVIMLECPACKRTCLDTEKSCDCGYSFKARSRDRAPAARLRFWFNLVAWAAGLGVLGCIVAVFGAAGAACRFFYPGATEGDACLLTGVATGLLGGIIGVIAGIVVAHRRNMRGAPRLNY
jgi:hypothetical protein